MAASNNIDMMVIFDTSRLKKYYNNFSYNKEKPVLMDTNNNIAFLIPYQISSKKGSVIQFKANPGDNVSIHFNSADNNNRDAVIIYNIEYSKGDEIFNDFLLNTSIMKKAVVPNVNSATGLPAVQQKMTFYRQITTIFGSGQGTYFVDFAVYSLDDCGEKQVSPIFYRLELLVNVL